MYSTLVRLLDCLDSQGVGDSPVLSWAAPVPFFGDLRRARIATVGLNPSSREFLDEVGNELTGEARRFHTLRSFNLESWSQVHAEHLDRILGSCRGYFFGNPYDRWFKRLDKLVSRTQVSYYHLCRAACHLDLIPYATYPKWGELTNAQQRRLLKLGSDCLAELLSESAVDVLILNGQSVVRNFQLVTGLPLRRRSMPGWALPRRHGSAVPGFSFEGIVTSLSGIQLDREVLVLGFNHNIQSSFGVTNAVTDAIAGWLERSTRAVVA